MSFKELCTNLEEKIKNSYEQGVTGTEAEKLAGEFLVAQLIVSEELKNAKQFSNCEICQLTKVNGVYTLDGHTRPPTNSS